MTTAGHRAFYIFILIISLYQGLSKPTHRNPDEKRCKTHPMPIPEPTMKDDDDSNNININDNLTSMKANQQNAHAHSGGYQREQKKKTRQLRPLWNTYRSPGTADAERCTPHQDDIIHDKKNKPTTGLVTPKVVTQVETFDGPARASSLTKSHGAAELHYETVHLRPWDVWLGQSTNQNGCATSMKKLITEYDNTPPRDTPATESQALVAKWMAPRAVRDNGADESPSRLLSGAMLFRPWDMWIQHASQAQKEGSQPYEKRFLRPRPRPGVTAH